MSRLRPGGLMAALLLALTNRVQGQSPSIDASLGVASGLGRGAISVPWRLAVDRHLVLGIGPRLTHFVGRPAAFPNRGAVTVARPDELLIDPSVWALNVMVLAEVRAGRFASGANLDLAGVAAGPKRGFTAGTLRPAPASLFLYGNRDLGSLNSEFYGGVRVSGRLDLRVGVSHAVVGYRLSEAGDASRYLRFDTVPFVAMSWKL